MGRKGKETGINGRELLFGGEEMYLFHKRREGGRQNVKEIISISASPLTTVGD
jgi:hypothetical protein